MYATQTDDDYPSVDETYTETDRSEDFTPDNTIELLSHLSENHEQFPASAPWNEWDTKRDWSEDFTQEGTIELLSHLSERKKMVAAVQPSVLNRILVATAFIAGVAAVIAATARKLEKKTASAPGAQERLSVAARAESAPETQGAGADGDAAVGARINSPIILPVSQLLRKLSSEQKELLHQRALPFIRNMGCRNMTELKYKVTENNNHKMIFVQILEDYITNDLKGVVKPSGLY